MKKNDFNDQQDDRAVWAKIQALLKTDPECMSDEIQPSTAVRNELKMQRIEALLGHPIPEKALLYVTDFHLMASSTNPLDLWFEYQWGLDGTLHLKLILDPHEGEASLKQQFRGNDYDAPLHWDSSKEGSLMFHEYGECELSLDEAQRLAVALKLPRVYHHWGHSEATPTMPVLLDKLAAMAQGIRVFLSHAQTELLAAWRQPNLNLYAVLEPLAVGSRGGVLRFAERGAAHQFDDHASKLPEVLLTLQALQSNELALSVDWGGVIPASPPPVEVELNDAPIEVQTVWQEGLRQLALQAEGLGRKSLELGWHWRLSDHRLRLFLRTGA